MATEWQHTGHTPGGGARPAWQTHLERALEAAVIFAALATIPLTIAQERGTTGSLVEAADWAIWTVFVVDYVVKLRLSPRRLAFVRREWLGLAIIVLSFPLTPALLSLVRLARLARLARLLRMLTVSRRGLRGLRHVLGRSGMVFVVAATAFLVFVGGGLLALLEPQSTQGGFWDGIWWGIVTATTVGYGDIAPTTAWGRLVAVGLMLAGVGLVSTLAGSISAHFIGQGEGVDLQTLADRLDKIEQVDLADLKSRLDRIEGLLNRIAGERG